MIICHCIAGPIAGGAENLVKDLAIEQSRLGHHVIVLFLNNASSVNRCLQYELQYINELESGNVVVKFPKGTGFKCLLKALYELKVKNSNQKVVIHAHLLKSLLAAFFLPKEKFKVIYTHHSVNLKVPSFFYKLLSMRVDNFVGISQVCADTLRRATGSDVSVIYNAINQSKIIKKKKGRELPLKIIMVGSFRWEKNYENLIEALTLIQHSDSGNKFHIDIFGEGKELKKVQNLIVQKGVTGLVTLKGNSPKVFEEYANYDAFFMCSVSEGLPISLIEASISGLPVAVTNVGGCKEVVQLLENGLVIEGTDPRSLSVGFMKLLSITNDYSKFELNDSAIHNFFIDFSARKHIELYRGGE